MAVPFEKLTFVRGLFEDTTVGEETPAKRR
jgi:hypothetical protein